MAPEFYPFPVVGGHLSDQILGHDLPKHLWDGREVGLVIFVLDAVDEGAELEDILPGTLVVPTQVLAPDPRHHQGEHRRRAGTERRTRMEMRTSQCTMYCFYEVIKKNIWGESTQSK